MNLPQGEMVKGKDSWSKKILTLAAFRHYPEKTRPDIEIEEWSKKQMEDESKGKREFQDVKESQNVKWNR